MSHFITLGPSGDHEIGGNTAYRSALEDVFGELFNEQVPEFIGAVIPFSLFDWGVCMNKNGETAAQELAKLQVNKDKLEEFLRGLDSFEIPSNVSSILNTIADKKSWVRENFTLVLNFMNSYMEAEDAYVEGAD